jgi:Uma2 family endonuclease
MSRHLCDMTTTAAEGLPRRRFTVAELERMTAAGILDEDERIELIGGEIVPMLPKGNQHEILKAALTVYWARSLPPEILFVTETTLRLTADTYLEPDFVFSRSPRASRASPLPPRSSSSRLPIPASATIWAAKPRSTRASVLPSFR